MFNINLGAKVQSNLDLILGVKVQNRTNMNHPKILFKNKNRNKNSKVVNSRFSFQTSRFTNDSQCNLFASFFRMKRDLCDIEGFDPKD